MRQKLENILKIIAEISSCGYCAVLDFKNTKNPILAEFSLFDEADSLRALCSEAAEKAIFDFGEIKILESFAAASNLNQIKSVMLRKVSERLKHLKLICFSKKNEAFNPESESHLEIFLKLIDDTIGTRNLIMDNADMPYIFTDLSGNILSANKKFKECCGFDESSDENLKSLILFNANGSDLEPENYPYTIAVKNNRNLTNVVYKHISCDGVEKWFNINSIIVKDNDGNAAGVFNSFEDISALLEIKQRIESAQTQVDVVYYSSDPHGSKYHFISDSAKTLFGHLPDEVYDNKFLILRKIFPEYVEKFNNFTRDLSRGSQLTIDYKVRDINNIQRFVRHSGIPIIENGEVTRVVGFIRDISDEKRVESALDFAKSKLDLFIDSTSEIVFNLNEENRFEMINHLGARFLGYEPEEFMGKEIFDFIRDDNHKNVKTAIDEIRAGTSSKIFVAEFKAHNRKIVKININARSYSENGRIRILGVGRNITEFQKDENKIKELSEKLNEANKIIEEEQKKAKHQINAVDELNKLKNDFISNISHELRTPLASIVGFAETLTFDTDLDKETVMEFSKIILDEGNRLSRLINDVLDFSEYETGLRQLNKAEFDLVSLIEEVIKLHSEKIEDKNIKLSFNHAAPQLITAADKKTIQKMVGNLLLNAIIYNNNDGKIEIQLNDLTELFELIVADTGVGIHENDLPKLFQKFRKINRPGSQLPGAGFGLVTVQQIVDLHNGTINIESKLNKGTKIIVRIPKYLNAGG